MVKQYHTSNRLSAISHECKYNSSASKKLILCYFRHNFVCLVQFCQRKYKDKAGLFVSEQHTVAFHFLIHILNELGEPFVALDLNRRCSDQSCLTSKYRKSN